MKSSRIRLFSILLIIAMIVQVVPVCTFAETIFWSVPSVGELNAEYGDIFSADDAPVTISEAKGIIRRVFNLDIEQSINGIPLSHIFSSGKDEFFTRKELAVLGYAILKLSPAGGTNFADCGSLTSLQKDAIGHNFGRRELNRWFHKKEKP